MTARKSAEELAREAGVTYRSSLDRLISLARAEERALALEEAAQIVLTKACSTTYRLRSELADAVRAIKDDHP